MSNIYIQEPPTNGKVLLKTSVGDIDIELWSKEAPKACRNFVQLCMEGYYDGVPFHRVVKDFIVQGGDPSETGDGGESVYGQPFKDEFHTRLRFVRRGLVAMANAGPNDNGSQFFFTMGTTPELQNKHTIFGKVVGDTLYNMLKLQEVEIGADERPAEPHRILSTEVLANPFDDIIPRQLKRNKKDRDEDKKVKSKSKATKNFSLLSFGEEAEEDEEQLDRATVSFRGKSKSSHDLTDDPRLSSVPAVEEEGKKKKMDSPSDDGRKQKGSPAHDEAKSRQDAEVKIKSELPAEEAKRSEEPKSSPPEVKKEPRKSRFSDITDDDRKKKDSEEGKKSRFPDAAEDDKKKKETEDEKKKKTDEDSSRKKPKSEEKNEEKKKKDSAEMSDDKKKKKSDERDDEKRKRKSDEHDDDRKKKKSDDHDDKRKRKSDENDDDRRKRRKEEEESERRKRKGDSRGDSREEEGRKKRKEEEEKDDGKKKIKAESAEKSPKGGDDKWSSTDDVRKKLKKEQEESPLSKDSKTTLESLDDSRKGNSSRMDELKKETRKLQRDIRDSKKRMEAESQAKEVKAKDEGEDAEEGKKDVEDPSEEGDLLAQVKKERQKYKLRKKMIGKKENREAATLAMLEKFQSRLMAARTLAGDYDDAEEEKEGEDEDDPSDMSWLRHKLHFEEEAQKKKVIDANIHDNDRYDISDPRNPLTQRRRETSKKAMRDKR